MPSTTPDSGKKATHALVKHKGGCPGMQKSRGETSGGEVSVSLYVTRPRRRLLTESSCLAAEFWEICRKQDSGCDSTATEQARCSRYTLWSLAPVTSFRFWGSHTQDRKPCTWKILHASTVRNIVLETGGPSKQ